MTVTNDVVRIQDQAFGISNNTNGAIVNYSIRWNYNTSLSNSASGKVYLEVSPDQSTLVWTTIAVAEFGVQSSLTLSLNLSQQVGMTLTGLIPTGNLVRLRTEGTVYSYVKGQEAVL